MLVFLLPNKCALFYSALRFLIKGAGFDRLSHFIIIFLFLKETSDLYLNFVSLRSWTKAKHVVLKKHFTLSSTTLFPGIQKTSSSGKVTYLMSFDL